MRKVIALTSLVFLLSAGAAFADRGRGRGRDGGRVVVRDQRGGGRGPSRVVVRRSPVYVTSGRYTFPNGVVRVYRRPVIAAHYYNVRVRPALIVETYDPVPGYIWVGGKWRWSGVEWIWISGYWAVDANY